MSKTITKSDVVRFTRCARLAYLARTHPELSNEPAGGFAEEGVEVEAFFIERLAARLKAPLSTVETGPLAVRASATRAAVASATGAHILRQASFIFDDVFVAFDALVVAADGSVTQYEIKSSSVDPDKKDDKKAQAQLLDTLIQYRTARLSGQRIDKVVLVRLNKNAVSPDWDSFFDERDITSFCESSFESAEVLDTIAAARTAVLSEIDVKATVGGHCKSPFKCPFFDVCHGVLPKDGIHTLHRLMPPTRKKLLDAGVTTIGAIPPAFPLSGVAIRQRQVAVSGRPFIDHEALRGLLALEGPIGFIDFETVMTALPKFDGYGPWAQVVIQASVHVTDAEGNILRHHEWLASRRSVKEGTVAEAAAAFLEQALAGCKTVVSYNQSFELTRMKEIAQRVPSFAETFAFATQAMVDLLKIVEVGYYHKDFGGSLSIKKVLPVLVPEMSYAGMEVENGLEAIETGLKLLFDDVTPEEEASMRSALLKYCHLDTLAMVEIYRALRFLTQNDDTAIA